jgi:uncharacterized protein YggT (Ycf19 family)
VCLNGDERAYTYIVLASSVIVVIFKSLCWEIFETYQRSCVSSLKKIDWNAWIGLMLNSFAGPHITIP